MGTVLCHVTIASAASGHYPSQRSNVTLQVGEGNNCIATEVYSTRTSQSYWPRFCGAAAQLGWMV